MFPSVRHWIPVWACLAAVILAPASSTVAASDPQSDVESRRQWTVLHRDIAEFKQARGRTRIDERARMWTGSHGGGPTWQEMVAQTHRQASLIFESDRDPLDIVLRRTEAMLQHLASLPRARNLEPLQRELSAFQSDARAVPPGDPARQALFDGLIALRRRVALANPLLDFASILFIKRSFCGGPGGETDGDHMVPQFWGRNGMSGGKAGGLFVLENAFTAKPRLRDVLAGSVCRNGPLQGKPLPPGGFLSPELSFDGKQVLFAYCEKGGKVFHLFRVAIDGGGLEQLSDGSWNDFDPCQLPDGRIAFISERRGGVGRCFGWLSPTYTLHRMDADGSNIRPLSVHETNEWQPSLAHDGRIVYTRWDYVDRGFNQAHHPWVTMPDGRNPRAPHGNYGLSPRLRPFMEIGVRAVPGSSRFIATATGHHYQAYGSLVLLDFSVPDDGAMAQVKRLTPEAYFPEAETREKGDRQLYATARPLSEDFWLCVYDADGTADRGEKNRFGIYLADAFGNKELLYLDPDISCLSPIPLAARSRPPVIPSPLADDALNPTRPTAPAATVSVMNVYDSRRAWPAGTTIKALRIVQVLPRPNSRPHKDEPRIGYAMDNGARSVLGTVPVESDGSAQFGVPAGKPLYFQALDARGLAVQSMRSDAYFQAGEVDVCQGCHEDPNRAPPPRSGLPLALRRAPSRIEPEPDGSNPLSFPRLVQPVLDARCVACHAKSPKAPDLSAGPVEKKGRPWSVDSRWSTSYTNLGPYTHYYDCGPGDWNRWVASNTIPGQFGARASKLFQLLDKGHYDVGLSPQELHRITLWLDANAQFFGS